MNKARRKAERRGRLAEWTAALWLVLKGYRIVALRYRTPLGEVDIVALKGDIAAFIEVKARGDLAAAVDAVSPMAQARIRAASEIWLTRRADAHRLSLRYDIIAVQPLSLPRHLPGAF